MATLMLQLPLKPLLQNNGRALPRLGQNHPQTLQPSLVQLRK